MDLLGYLVVRFHFGGEFVHDGKSLNFCGGREAISHIDRDKVSLPEVVGHLKDHCSDVEVGSLLHWLYPGKELNNGLRALVDDKACMDMSNTTDDGCVADVYVEHPSTQDISTGEESDYEHEMEFDGLEAETEDDEELDEEDLDLGSGAKILRIIQPKEKVLKEIQLVKEFYSPRKGKAAVEEGTKKER